VNTPELGSEKDSSNGLPKDLPCECGLPAWSVYRQADRPIWAKDTVRSCFGKKSGGRNIYRTGSRPKGRIGIQPLCLKKIYFLEMETSTQGADEGGTQGGGASAPPVGAPAGE
jgi:hypothetical protein